MRLETQALDCLYVNWALPLEAAPELPEPLRYEVHDAEGEGWIFASALLFRLSGLHFSNLPWMRVSYPQMSLRLYVLDARGLPSVLFLRVLVPFWVAPASALVARQPAHAAQLEFPKVIRTPGETWQWRVQRPGSGLRLEASATDPPDSLETPIRTGPSLGSWAKTVAYFRHRPRGYVLWKNRVRSVRTNHPPMDVWPMAVRVEEGSLLSKTFTEIGSEGLWSRPHSAWLCPAIPFSFELGKPRRIPLARVSAAGTYCCRPSRPLC